MGYSKLSINDQNAAVEELNQVVRGSQQFQKAEAADRLLKIATGDGMALVFYKSPEEPAQCAFELSRALKDNQRLQVRMGSRSVIHEHGCEREAASLNKRAPSRFAREDARSFLNSYSLLGAVRRPEARAGDVRQNVVVSRLHLRNGIDRLNTVSGAEEVRARVIQHRILLQVARPVRGIDRVTGAAVGFDGVLVNCGVDHTQIIEDSAGLGTFTGTEESGHRDRGQERDDRNNDHDFHEGEAPAAFIKFVQHC